MKRKINISLFLLALLILALSCTKELEVDIPNNDPKLVVHCFISPQQDTLKAYVSKSRPVGEYGSTENLNWWHRADIVENAVVVISNSVGESKTAQFVTEDTEYSIDKYYQIITDGFSIQEGETYKLSVSAPGFQSVWASVAVPLAYDVNMKFKGIKHIDNEFNNVFLYSFDFTDLAGAENFYSASAYSVVDGWEGNQYMYNTAIDEYFSDANFDGKDIGIQFVSYYDIDTTHKVVVRLYHIDKHYFTYSRSVDNYDEMPFSEPTPIYSNVENGLGCFGSFTYSTYSFTIEP